MPLSFMKPGTSNVRKSPREKWWKVVFSFCFEKLLTGLYLTSFVLPLCSILASNVFITCCRFEEAYKNRAIITKYKCSQMNLPTRGSKGNKVRRS